MSDNSHEETNDEQTFMIPDEQGNEHEMVLVFTFSSDDQNYAVLLEKDNLEADGVIFRIEQEDEDVYLINIEDDEEWERVVAVYNEEVATMSENSE